ncbi:hypothetical protein BCV71DRAFT_144992, partial [Rhizopus microsporus]
SSSLTVQSRNIWFRLLYSKIPSCSTLHQPLPTVFYSDKCILCLSSVEDIPHFVFNCPNKQFIWTTIWEQHFD